MFAIDLPLGFSGEAAAEVAGRAEDEGLDGVWSSEAGHDPYLPLGLVAAATERITLGTAIAVAFPRSPLVHAQVGWDLQRASRGRFILGLGAQVRAHNVRRYGVPGDRPAARMRDMVRAIRAIWRSWQEAVPLDYRGEFYSHTLMTPFFDPGPVAAGPPPIYLAAVTPAMLRVAGSEAEGVHVHPFHTERSLDELTLPVARQGALEAGRDPARLAFCVPAMIATGRFPADVARARESLRAQLAFYASTPAYRVVLAIEGREALGDDLTALARRGRWGEMAERIDDDLLAAVVTTATWDRLAVALATRYRGRADRLMPYGQDAPAAPWREVAAALHGVAGPRAQR